MIWWCRECGFEATEYAHGFRAWVKRIPFCFESCWAMVRKRLDWKLVQLRDTRVPARREGMWRRQRVDGDLRAVEELALRAQQTSREIRADLHLALAARTAPGRASRDLVPGDASATRFGADQLTGEGEHRRSTGVGEEAEVPDADETARQNVLREAAQKLAGRKSHSALLVAVGVVAPEERDLFAIEGQQAMVADGDAMGITAEIAKCLSRSAEGWFGIDDPVFLEQRIDEAGEAPSILEFGSRPGKAEFPLPIELA